MFFRLQRGVSIAINNRHVGGEGQQRPLRAATSFGLWLDFVSGRVFDTMC